MSWPISRTIIGAKWRFVHVCDELKGLFEAGDPVDAGSVAIIRGFDDKWWLRDKDHDSFFAVNNCPGCGKGLAEAFSELDRVGKLDPEGIRRIPEVKGLEG